MSDIRMSRTRCVVVFFLLVLYSASIESLLRSNVAKQSLGGSSVLPSAAFRITNKPLAFLDIKERSSQKHRQSSCLYGLDLFGLGAPEIVICGLAVAVLYGPDRIKGQLKDNGVKGQIVAEGWREEHNERVADVKKYAVMSRKKRAWKKINLAIEREDPLMLAKLADLDARNPDTVKALSASMDEKEIIEDDDDDDDYDDDEDDDDDDDEVVV